MKKPIIIILIALAVVVLVQDFLKVKKDAEPIAPRPYVVMLSLDGFRWDYQDKTETPNLDFITKNGVKADGLKPTFPSKTFPNHYSIATGLHPGNHGLVSNTFFDPKSKQVYAIRNRDRVEDAKFYWGEPIWVTAEAQRVKTASYFWVGSEAKIKGYFPSYYKKYDHDFPYGQRIDSVISWLDKPYVDRPHLVTWYLDRTDGVGHNYGPDGPEINVAIQELDSLIGVFLSKAEQLNIKDSLNFIIVSDHGMGNVTEEQTVFLSDYLNPEWTEAMYGGTPFIMVQPKKKCTDSIIEALHLVKGIKVYRKEDLPERYQLKDNPRVSDVLVLADSSWSVQQDRKADGYGHGTHGYDNENRDMYGIFYGIGPAFKVGYNAGNLSNLDIYSLIAEIMEIRPASTDGSLEGINHVLINSAKP